MAILHNGDITLNTEYQHTLDRYMMVSKESPARLHQATQTQYLTDGKATGPCSQLEEFTVAKILIQ